MTAITLQLLLILAVRGLILIRNWYTTDTRISISLRIYVSSFFSKFISGAKISEFNELLNGRFCIPQLFFSTASSKKLMERQCLWTAVSIFAVYKVWLQVGSWVGRKMKWGCKTIFSRLKGGGAGNIVNNKRSQNVNVGTDWLLIAFAIQGQDKNLFSTQQRREI